MDLRSTRVHAVGIATGLVLAIATSLPVAAKAASAEKLTADLDGQPIRLSEVGRWYCDDFSYPAIHCYSSPELLEGQVGTLAAIAAVAAVDYVTVYEYSSFAGSYMHMSQDYTALVTIGWNDRISSLRIRNSQQSHFFTDWFYGGTIYFACCNTQVSSLGTLDNTFSSVHRN
jgi:hypothetical protein